MQIPKAQKTVKSSALFALLGPARAKAVSKTLVKLTPGISLDKYWPVTTLLEPSPLWKICLGHLSSFLPKTYLC